jgi:hypothetical protein
VSVVAAAIGFRLLSSGPQAAPAASVMLPSDVPAFTATPSNAADVVARVTWPTEMARDPFDSDLVFPPAAPPPTPEPKVDVSVTKPVPPPVDVPALAREKIHLKGTVLGDRPIAMMNGRVYRVGEVVEGFKIVEIVTNQITVERGGSRVVIEAN